MGQGARRVQVIGIGSGMGLDEIGWRIVERLAGVDLHALVPAVEWVTGGCAVPAQLPAMVSGAHAVVLIDALPAAEPGSVRRIDAGELADAAAGCSSHGIDLRQALALIALLAVDRPEILIYGVGVGDISETQVASSSLDDVVARATPVVLEMLAADFR